MARTSESLVRGLLLKDYDNATSPDLAPFIDSAGALVDQVVACGVRKEVTVTNALAELIERWLAAHAYCMNDPQYSEKQTGRSKGVYLGDKNVKGLEGSRYGQHAKLLDPTGYLRSLDKTGAVGIQWLGLRESEQTAYEDRR